MNHYCTYFDRGYLAQGLSLWRSLRRQEPGAQLWVLALDEDAAAVMAAFGSEGIRVVPSVELLAADAELAAVQGRRSRQEFIFTLTPCLVRHLLVRHADIAAIAYLDADLYFFGNPGAIWRDLGNDSVLAIEHRFPGWHDDSANYGRFNVGVLAFRNDAKARACLDWWRTRCLESCALTTDGTHYGDQKYLDHWPELGVGFTNSAHPGINVAPWNWQRHAFEVGKIVKVDGQSLIVFHFAQFRRLGNWWCDSGQLEYGIMPLRLRSRLYGEYWAALESAEAEVATILPRVPRCRRTWRETLGSWRMGLLRFFWGQCWFRVGPWLITGRGGIGQLSGRFMAWYRRRRVS